MSAPLTHLSRMRLHWSILAMIASAACWGLGIVMSKAALTYVPPAALLTVQLFGSLAVLWGLTFALRFPIERRDLRHGLPGIFEPGIAYLIGIAGTRLTSASNASLIAALEPFIILVIAWLVLRERLSYSAAALLLVAMLGVLLITGTNVEGGSASLTGDLLVFGGTVSAAVYVILSRRSVQTLDPLPLAAVQQTCGLLFVLIALPLTGVVGEARAIAVPMGVWPFAVFTGVVQYALAFSLYLTALKHMPAIHAAIYLTLIPLFGVGGAALFLGETMTTVQLLGGVLIIGALAGLNATRRVPS